MTVIAWDGKTLAAEGELKQIIAQLEINAREAAHPSVWVAGAARAQPGSDVDGDHRHARYRRFEDV